jgi:Sec-independent protein translocase protein TatA
MSWFCWVLLLLVLILLFSVWKLLAWKSAMIAWLKECKDKLDALYDFIEHKCRCDVDTPPGPPPPPGGWPE